MSPKKGRARPGDRSVAVERLVLAEDRLEYAALALERGHWNIAAELSVTAGINASDAICSLVLGEYSVGEDHRAAGALLARADRSASNALKRLLSLKSRAAYGEPIGKRDGAAAVRAARSMVETARSRLSA